MNCIVETTDGNIPEGATYTWYKSDKINSGDSVNEVCFYSILNSSKYYINHNTCHGTVLIWKARVVNSDLYKSLTPTQKFLQNKLVPLAGYESSVLYYPSVSRDATGYYHCKVETTNPPYKIFSSTAKVVVSIYCISCKFLTFCYSLSPCKLSVFLVFYLVMNEM